MNDLQKEKLTTWLLSDGSFQSGDHLEEITDAIRSAIEAHETLQYLEEAILSIPEEYRNQISDEYRVLRGEVSRCSVCDEIVEPHEGVTTYCPKLFPVSSLLKYKKKLGTYSFAALYQQRPVPAEGGRFKRAWFRKIIDAPPPGLKWKRGYDLAISTRTSADYTASFRCARDAAGYLYIADGFRSRIEYPEQRRYIIERMSAEPDTEHGIEDAGHGRAVVQDLRGIRSLSHRPLRSIRVESDKLTRALAWLNLAEEGRIYLVRGPWIDEFVDEVCSFPAGRHDDQIDAVSLAVRMIADNVGKRTAWGF